MKGGAVSVVRGGKVALVNCELSNTLSHSLRLEGASCNMCYTTICNWYPFDLRQGEAVSIVADSTGKESELHAEASVVDGSMANEVHCDEASLMRFNQCYIRAKGLGEGSIEAKLAADSTYTHVGRDLEKNEYDFIYDYRPLPKAPFVARPTTDQTPLHDRFGVPRSTSAAWGAYEPSEAKEPKRNWTTALKQHAPKASARKRYYTLSTLMLRKIYVCKEYPTGGYQPRNSNDEHP